MHAHRLSILIPFLSAACTSTRDAAPLSTASVEAYPTAKPSAEEELHALEQEYSVAENTLRAELAQLSSDEERVRVYSEKKPDTHAYAQRFRAIADENPGTETAARALGWIAANALYTDAAQAAFDDLATDHLSSPVLADVSPLLAFRDDEHAAELLSRIAEEAPEARTRGIATYALATHRYRAAENRGDGSSALARAEALFELVITEYGDVDLHGRTLADRAGGDLYALRALAIGKVAPDIEGEDVEGEAFKLSDYRGKVVVLDFWGNW